MEEDKLICPHCDEEIEEELIGVFLYPNKLENDSCGFEFCYKCYGRLNEVYYWYEE